MYSIKDQSKRIAGWGIIVLAFIIPSGLYSLDLAVLALIGIARILQGDIRQYRPFLKKPTVFFPILFYLYIFSGFFFSKNFGQALSTLSEKLPFLLYPLIIGCTAGIEEGVIRKARRAFVLSLVLSLAIAVLYAAGDMLITHVCTVQLGESFYNKWNWYGLTRVFKDWHPSYVAAFCNLAIAFLLWPQQPSTTTAGKEDKRRPAGYAIAASLFLSGCVFLLNSVTGIITWCCLLLCLAAIWLHRRRMPLAVNLGAGIALVALLAGFLYVNPLALEKINKLREKGWSATDKQDQRTVLSIRVAKWSTYLEIFREHPLFGTTAGDIKDLRKVAYTKKGYTDLALYNYNAHNQYIETLTAYGIAGCSLFLAVLWVAIPLNKQSNPLLLPFMLITLISFTTESFLERQQGLNFFMFFYSLLSLRMAKSS